MSVDVADLLDRVHLVGIGGAGMSSIARVLIARGADVSGSDVHESTAVAGLRALGARIWLGQDPPHLDGARLVVTSSAIPADNPELLEAHRRGLPVVSRAELLAALLADHRAALVTGTHGKTTTTSMLAVGLQQAGWDPSFAIGGHLNESGSNAHHGSGEVFVAEADESDGSFLVLAPSCEVALVTSVGADHLNYWGTVAEIQWGFARFVTRMRPAATLVACADDEGAARTAAAARGSRPVVTYGREPTADAAISGERLSSDGSRFLLGLPDRAEPVAVQIAVPGAHNVTNAAGALTAGWVLGAPVEQMAEGLARFRGVRRRFELRGERAGVRVYDEYAHNPIKVAAALATARLVAGPGRVLVAFQPHRYSRLAAFVGEFAQVLSQADAVAVLEVYAAGEAPIPGVTGAAIAAAISLPADRVRFEPGMARAARWLAEQSDVGDVVVTIGAGDITAMPAEILAALAERTDSDTDSGPPP